MDERRRRMERYLGRERTLDRADVGEHAQQMRRRPLAGVRHDAAIARLAAVHRARAAVIVLHRTGVSGLRLLRRLGFMTRVLLFPGGAFLDVRDAAVSRDERRQRHCLAHEPDQRDRAHVVPDSSHVPSAYRNGGMQANEGTMCADEIPVDRRPLRGLCCLGL